MECITKDYIRNKKYWFVKDKIILIFHLLLSVFVHFNSLLSVMSQINLLFCCYWDPLAPPLFYVTTLNSVTTWNDILPSLWYSSDCVSYIDFVGRGLLLTRNLSYWTRHFNICIHFLRHRFERFTNAIMGWLVVEIRTTDMLHFSSVVATITSTFIQRIFFCK